MRITLIFFLLFMSIGGFAQNATKTQEMKKDSVSFTTVLDIANATKDGIYLNGYVVNISYAEAQKLHGKNIRVSGKVTVVKGLENEPDGEIMQGRQGDSYHIKDPKIELIN